MTCIPCLDGKLLADHFASRQRSLFQTVAQFNSHPPGIQKLRSFLVDCGDLFYASERLLRDSQIAEAIGMPIAQQNTDANVLINVSVHDVLETGLNILLLADAGAGKTTTLQMYAKRRFESLREDELVLFIPLAKMVWAMGTHNPGPEKMPAVELLENGIVAFLRSIGISVGPAEIVKTLRRRRGILLFDGLDEAVARSPWIVKGINEFNQRYPNLQCVVSSRMTGNYVKEIRLFAITLRPFTFEQRTEFIKAWFHPRNPGKSESLLSHIKEYPELGEIIRTPLLATILCVLAENDVPLPRREIRLYEERMRLLLGHYDLHKKAARLKSPNYLLEAVCKKAAYGLHLLGRRYAEAATLETLVVNDLRGEAQKENVVQAFRELCEPCNVLLPMTEDGELGFGHLRFQEYLVACELRTNRSVEIAKHLGDDWWDGAFVLFAQMPENLEFIFDVLPDCIDPKRAFETLQLMIDARPIQEQGGLNQIRAQAFEASKLPLPERIEPTEVDEYPFSDLNGEQG